MAVIFVGLGNVSDYLAHLFGVWTGSPHTLLSFTHFARRHHFHGGGDLLRALDASDLVTYFFSDGHKSLPFQARHSKGPADPHTGGPIRSEEHTSELQSRPHLVCRLLLEKKKNN